jgi:integrase
MSLRLRGGIYHCDFVINGQRVRQTLETSDWREARQRERDKIRDAKEGKLASGTTAEFSRLLFPHAIDRYLAELAVQRPGSVRRAGQPHKSWEGDLTNRLRSFFEGKRLNQISADDIRAYQAERLGKGKHSNTINHEVKALLRVLKRAKLLSRVRDDVKLLSVKREGREMLTPAEKQRLFEIAAKEPEWQTAYCAALLTANTSMRPVELKRLKWEDIDPFNRLVMVRVSKTDAGTRVIPLNDDAYSAIEALKERSEDAKAYDPESYVFHRYWPTVDGSKPMGRCGWRRAWRSLREEAAKPDKEKGREAMPKLARLRFYDLRHLFVTELCEAGIPESVIRELAGHIDPDMTRHYSHPRLAARRAAVEVLATVKAPPSPATPKGGYVTSHVTKALPAANEASQVIEGVGRGARI